MSFKLSALPSPISMALGCWKGVVYFLKGMFSVFDEIFFDLATTLASFVLIMCSAYTFYLQQFDYINCPDSGETNGVHPGRFCFFSGIKPNCTANNMNTCYGDASYHWTPFILLIQAFCCYFPRGILNQLNGKKWEKSLYSFVVIERDTDQEKRKSDLHHAFYDFLERLFGYHYLANLTVVCEMFIAFTYAFQIYFIKSIFNTRFYGEVDNGNNFDAIFPKTMQCSHPEVGENFTTVYKVDECEIPLNTANECIYAYQWQILNMLFGMTTFVFLYRLVSFIFYKSNAFNCFEFGRVCRGKVSSDNLVVVAEEGFNKWLTLRRLAVYLKADDFNLLLQVLAREMAGENLNDDLMEANRELMVPEINAAE